MDDADRLESLQTVADAILGGAGSLTATLRHAAFARAAELSGSSHTVIAQLPTPLVTFVEKVARHAFKITDSDIDALH